jgi:ATP-dependent protease ClpP protease subunit
MKYYYLTGDVNAVNVNSVIAPMLDQIHTAPQEPAYLYISSTGGDIDSAIRLYDFIKSSNLTITTVGFGQIDSAAIIVFLAGSQRILIKNCRLRLHPPIYHGPQSQILLVHQEALSLFQALDKRYFEIISNETLKSEAKIKKMYTNGKILSPREALTMKLATEIKEKLP